MSRNHKRGMSISFFVIGITLLNYFNLSGRECIRAIHVITLLVCGMAIGVFITHFFGFLMKKKT